MNFFGLLVGLFFIPAMTKLFLTPSCLLLLTPFLLKIAPYFGPSRASPLKLTPSSKFEL